MGQKKNEHARRAEILAGLADLMDNFGARDYGHMLDMLADRCPELDRETALDRAHILVVGKLAAWNRCSEDDVRDVLLRAMDHTRWRRRRFN